MSDELANDVRRRLWRGSALRVCARILSVLAGVSVLGILLWIPSERRALHRIETELRAVHESDGARLAAIAAAIQADGRERASARQDLERQAVALQVENALLHAANGELQRKGAELEQQLQRIATERVDLVRTEWLKADARARLHAASVEAYKLLRQTLIDRIWRDGPTYARMPDRVEEHAPIPGLSTPHAARELLVQMPHDVASRAFLLTPVRGADCLMIYHSGHLGSRFVNDDEAKFMDEFLASGCDVVYASMPGHGANYNENAPEETDHDKLSRFDSASLSAMKFFLEPAIVSLNYALSRRQYGRIGMAGLSGGGWATAFVGAIDVRIQSTYSVAGSLPLYLRTEAELSDWEQSKSDIFQVVGYEDLYILMALEEDRASLHVYNRYDPCCFAGARAYLLFPQLARAADEMHVNGIDFLVEEGKDTGHSISPMARDAIKRHFFSEPVPAARHHGSERPFAG